MEKRSQQLRLWYSFLVLLIIALIVSFKIVTVNRVVIIDQTIDDKIAVKYVSLVKGGFFMIRSTDARHAVVAWSEYLPAGKYRNFTLIFKSTPSPNVDYYEIQPNDYLVAELYFNRGGPLSMTMVPTFRDATAILARDLLGMPVRIKFAVSRQ